MEITSPLMSYLGGAIRKIDVAQLRPGMYVHDLNVGWLDHSFWRRRFMVRHEGTVDAIQREGIREVFIDTHRGLDVAPEPVVASAPPDLGVSYSRVAEIRRRRAEQTTLGEERRRARHVDQEARAVVHSAMQEVRGGRPVGVRRMRPLVDKMVASVLRQPDALVPAVRSQTPDRYHLSHPVSSSALMIAFGNALELSQEEICNIALGALVHDIGKARVSDRVLNKPGRLTPGESVQVRTHVVESRSILLDLPDVAIATMAVAAQHHERYDGSGYPNRLVGEKISLYGQMAGIVDVYDALTSDSCYHKAIAPTEALRRIYEMAPTQFKPELVQAFVRAVGVYPVGTLVRLDNGTMGVVVEQHADDLLRPVVNVFYDAKARCYLPPVRQDLARRSREGWLSIVSAESFENWAIDGARWQPV